MAYEPIHILYLSSWYPNEHQPHVGNFVRRQAQLLAKSHMITVIHTVAHADEKALRMEKTTTGNLTEYIVYHKRVKTLLGKRSAQRKALCLAMEELEQVDLLLTQILLPKGLQFIDARKNFDCPWIHIEQGSYFRSEVRQKWSLGQKLIVRRTAKHINLLLAVSDFLRKDLKQVFPKHKIELISNHVDIERFCIKPKASVGITKFLHVSTLDEATKNPRGIFDACKRLQEQGMTNFSLQIISDEPTEKWENYCKETSISDLVKFDGPKKWEELPNFYHEADAFILNSIYETFSIVVAESWATGTPVISTPVGIAFNLPEALGLQTEINNTESVATAMSNIINHEQTFDAKVIRDAAANYSESAVNDAIQEFIQPYVK
jgi:glycosyltransferase involved in cell wall biosynthesis